MDQWIYSDINFLSLSLSLFLSFFLPLPLSADTGSGAILLHSGAIFVVTTADQGKISLNGTLVMPVVNVTENGKRVIIGSEILRVEFPYPSSAGEVYLPAAECVAKNVERQIENKLPRFSAENFAVKGFQIEVRRKR